MSEFPTDLTHEISRINLKLDEEENINQYTTLKMS